ncbi:MAG: hypothetical protein HQK53_14080 [Oligoflexia bacterium]|nr:hypothetical protein [Oligoflexia bacterium]
MNNTSDHVKKDGPKQDIILYIGEDMRYWNQVQQSINAITGGKPIVYRHRKIDTFKNLATQVLYIIKLSPRVIYLDFGANPLLSMTLGKLFVRSNSTKKITLIALVDGNAEQQQILEISASGIFLSHIKGIEIHDVAYDTLLLMYPKENIRCKFATAATKKEVDILESVRIRYINADHILLEGNAVLEKNDALEVSVPVLTKIVPSKQFLVKEIGDSNLYYDFLYWYKLTYQFIDPVPPPAEGESQVDVQLKEKERKESILRVKKDFTRWIVSNSDQVVPTCKVLVIDKRLRPLKDIHEKDRSYSIGIRFQHYLEEDHNEIVQYQPHIIVYGFDPDLSNLDLPTTSDEGSGNKKNSKADGNQDNNDTFGTNEADLNANPEKLEHDDFIEGFDLKNVGNILKQLPVLNDVSFENMITAIKKIPNYSPIIVTLSNLPYHNSEYFRSKFKYSKIIHDRGVFDYEKISKFEAATRKYWDMAEEKSLKEKIEKLKKINPSRYRSVRPTDIRERTVYFKKKDARSFVYIRHSITITSISESEMQIESSKKLRILTVYLMSIPVDISITPISETVTKTNFIYRCVIHSAGEKEKSAIRQMVNDVFLASKRQEREKEAEMFKTLNQNVRMVKKQQEDAATATTTQKSKEKDLKKTGSE